MTDPDLNAVQQQLGMTLNELASVMGVHKNTLYKWLRGEQKPPAVALQMARLLILLQRRCRWAEWVDLMTAIRRKDDHDPK